MGAMAADGDGHGAEGGRPAPQTVRGLAVSEGGLTLDLARAAVRPRERTDLAFRIADRGGRTVRDFDVEHTKRMHLIVVRRDLTGFQHLHPTQRAGRHVDGPADAPRGRLLPRVRRLLARRTSRARSRATCRRRRRCARGRSPRPAPRRRDRRPARAPGQATPHAGAEADLRFTVTRDGRPVAVEPYLGAAATSSRCARATSPSCTSTPTTGRACASMADVPDRGPLPPVPAVQARRPCPHRRVHPGGGAMSATHRDHVELPITRHDLRLVREPRRAQAQQARRRQRDGQLRDREGRRRVRPGGGRARAARRRRRGRGLRRGAARAADAGRGDAAAPSPTSRARCAAGSSSPRCCRCPVLLLSMIPALQFDNWQWLVAAARHAGRALGRVAVPPRRLGEPAPRRGDDGHAGLLGVARRLAVVAVRAVPRRRRHDRHEDGASTLIPSAAAAPTRSTSRPPRSSRRSSSPAATSRRAPSAAPAPR